MAFYWIRWLPRGGDDVPVFLPGFKADKLVDVPVGPASPGGEQRQAVLRYKVLSKTPASTATAVTSPDGRLLQLAFECRAGRNRPGRGTEQAARAPLSRPEGRAKPGATGFQAEWKGADAATPSWPGLSGPPTPARCRDRWPGHRPGLNRGLNA